MTAIIRFSMVVFFCRLAPAQVVLVPEGMKDPAEKLVGEHPKLRLSYYGKGNTALEQIGDVDAHIGTPDEALMNAGTKLKWVHVMSAGIDQQVNLPGFVDGKVTVTSLKIYQGPEIADHALRSNELILENIARFAKGLPLKNVVDPAKGC